MSLLALGSHKHDKLMMETIDPDLAARAIRLKIPRISIHLAAIFYEVTKERHSVRGVSRFSLNVLRFESDLFELNRL